MAAHAAAEIACAEAVLNRAGDAAASLQTALASPAASTVAARHPPAGTTRFDNSGDSVRAQLKAELKLKTVDEVNGRSTTTAGNSKR